MILVFLSLVLMSSHVLHADTRIKRQEDSTNTCTTPENKPGVCRSIRDCPALIELLKKTKQDNSTANLLSRSKCGGSEEVCCAKESYDDSCGKPAVEAIIKGRIVGGEEAKLGAWPWIAALGYRKIYNRNSQVKWKCGGSLINKRYILTAAHCIRIPPQWAVQLAVIRLGVVDLSNKTEGANPVDCGFEKTIVHENYNYFTSTNDIALVKLDRDVSYSDHIRPICLPDALINENLQGKHVYVAGWGETISGGNASDVLLQVRISVVDNEICKKAYSKLDITITSEQLCAGDPNGGKDSCKGDSGGPLMLPENGVFYQIGTVSFGYGCGIAEYPGVYARVTSYLDWIKENTNDLS